ncbi:hypothetical protein MtrunA17_Chr1g0190361 [Medicago truncatula]|uniref:Transmembrane protein n=1 Tax=Medicago truncatula TaxID=3880 RepID=A0A396JSX2_MEDTR|nr:hypothetical protein MtrunA17_Chr1g0190361 [Medicago truncatula]
MRSHRYLYSWGPLSVFWICLLEEIFHLALYHRVHYLNLVPSLLLVCHALEIFVFCQFHVCKLPHCWVYHFRFCCCHCEEPAADTVAFRYEVSISGYYQEQTPQLADVQDQRFLWIIVKNSQSNKSMLML